MHISCYMSLQVCLGLVVWGNRMLDWGLDLGEFHWEEEQDLVWAELLLGGKKVRLYLVHRWGRWGAL